MNGRMHRYIRQRNQWIDDEWTNGLVDKWVDGWMNGLVDKWSTTAVRNWSYHTIDIGLKWFHCI